MSTTEPPARRTRPARFFAFLAAFVFLGGCAGERGGAGSTLDSEVDAEDSGQAEALAIRDVTVVDVEAGRSVPGQTVLIRGDRIAAVGSTLEVEVPAEARSLDGRGRFLIPGLWDAHVHALWDRDLAEDLLSLFVAQGVTGIRDMGGSLEVLAWAREARAAGRLVALRILAAGPILDGPAPVHPSISRALETEEEARAAVRELAAAGVDFVKVYTLLPRAAYLGALEEAVIHGLPVAGHLPAEVQAGEAAAAGQRTIEHLRDEIGPLCDLDGGGCGPLFEAFSRWGTWQTPTLTVLRAKTHLDEDRYGQDPRLERMPGALRAEWDGIRAQRLAQATPASRAEDRARYAGHQDMVRAMAEADVPLLAGTDAGVLYAMPGYGLHDELELLVEAGLTPAQALRAATLSPARAFGLEAEIGTVEVGKSADLVLLDADPLVDISATRRIRAVLLAGEVFDAERLARLLDPEAADGGESALR